MGRYQVLVDSSVWIEYFRNGTVEMLDRLIMEDLVCTNEVILTELIPALNKLSQAETIESLESLERIPLQVDWEIIRQYQSINLQNGLHKVGIPDLLILQQAIDQKLTLLTYDKHFKLMQPYFHFELLT
ncbi:MAG: PIN domain-containing protein [Cyclobacteriaceae bacterium]